MSHTDYGFMDMLKEIFSGNNVSGGKHDRKKGPDVSRRDGYSGDFSTSSRSNDFDPSDAAGEAFRSVFGDDN